MCFEGKKYYYKVYGLEIESDIEFNELLVSENNEEENKIKIICNDMPDHINESIINNKTGYFSMNEIWFQVKDVATYRVTNGNTIEFRPFENADPYILRVYLMCSCLGFIMIQKNIIAIHGGAAVLNNKGIIITGDRGAGKSTLTTALRLKGYKFITDDVARIEINDKPIIAQGFPYQKLCGDAMDKLGYDKNKYFSFMSDKERKYLVPAKEDFTFKDIRFNALFLLRVGDVKKVEINEVLGREKLFSLIDNRYREEFISILGGTTGEAFKQFIEIAKNIKVFKIVRPDKKITVDEQIRLIEEKIEMLEG